MPRVGYSKKLYDCWYGLLRRHSARPGQAPGVCERWRASFQTFAQEVGSPAKPGAVLCLKDRRLGFCPANVYWGTPAQRQQTVAHARLIASNGRVQTLTAWAKQLGILRRTLRERLARVPVDQALVPKAIYQPPPRRPKTAHRSSPFFGVYRKGQKWQASIKLEGRLCYLGLFVRETDAARAVQRARLQRELIHRTKRLAQTARGQKPPEAMLSDLKTLVAESTHAVVLSPHWLGEGKDPMRMGSKFHTWRRRRSG